MALEDCPLEQLVVTFSPDVLLCQRDVHEETFPFHLLTNPRLHLAQIAHQSHLPAVVVVVVMVNRLSMLQIWVTTSFSMNVKQSVKSIQLDLRTIQVAVMRMNFGRRTHQQVLVMTLLTLTNVKGLRENKALTMAVALVHNFHRLLESFPLLIVQQAHREG
jgi:hypothetical protein